MLALYFSVLICASLFSSTAAYANTPSSGYTVAFVGDTGMRTGKNSILEKFKEWNLDAVIHAGDLSYSYNAKAWWTHLDRTFDEGKQPAFIATSGNHDLSRLAAPIGKGYSRPYWHSYATEFRIREEAAGAECRGSPGEMEVCYLNGIVYVNLGYGLEFDRFEENRQPNDYAHFIAAAFRAYPDATWRICHFHIPVLPYALDSNSPKENPQYWAVMNECNEHGAIVANAHHHSYSRTHMMSSFEEEKISEFINGTHPGVLAPGYSLQWVSGLGGARPDPIDRGLAIKPFFAKRVAHHSKINSAPEGTISSGFGALVCEFDPLLSKRPPRELSTYQRADCEYRDVRDQIHDKFTLYSRSLRYDLAVSKNAVQSARVIVNAEEERWRGVESCVANGKTDPRRTRRTASVGRGSSISFKESLSRPSELC